MNRVVIGILLFGAVILLAPLLREGIQGPAGSESYYHLRMAQTLLHGPIPQTDPALITGASYHLNPLHVILIPFIYLFGPTFGLLAITFLCGLLTIVAAILLARRWTTLSFILPLLLILSPLFISTFSSVSTAVIATPLFLWAIVLLIHPRFYVLALPLLGILSLLSTVHCIASIIAALAIGYYQKARTKYLLVISMSIPILIYHVSILYTQTTYSQNGLLDRFFFDFGSPTGFSILFLLLASMGVYFFWEHKRTYYALVPLLIGTIIYSIIDVNAVMYANLIVVFLASIAIERMAIREWNIRILQGILLTIIFVSLFSSTVSAVTQNIQQPPSADLQTALQWMAENLTPNPVTFSHYSYGYYLETVAHQKAVLDPGLERITRSHEVYLDTLELFHTYDKQELARLIHKYHIRYILITADMEESLVWEKPGRGLSYTANNFETFNKVYSSDGISIFEVIQ